MKKFLFDLIIFSVCLAGIAAAAFWPAAAPAVVPVYTRAESEFSSKSILNVLLQDSKTGEERYFSVPADCTYGQLFDLAGTEDVGRLYDPEQRLSYADAVLIGREYYLYIILLVTDTDE